MNHFKGQIKFIDWHKGLGFIVCADFAKELFFETKNLQGDPKDFLVETQVQFQVLGDEALEISLGIK